MSLNKPMENNVDNEHVAKLYDYFSYKDLLQLNSDETPISWETQLNQLIDFNYNEDREVISIDSNTAIIEPNANTNEIRHKSIIEMSNNNLKPPNYNTEGYLKSRSMCTFESNTAQCKVNESEIYSTLTQYDIDILKFKHQNYPIAMKSILYFLSTPKNSFAIHTIDLKFCNMKDDGAHALSKVIVNFTNLTKLLLSHNQLTVRGIASIAKSLLKHSSLQTVDLSHNNLGVDTLTHYKMSDSSTNLMPSFASNHNNNVCIDGNSLKQNALQAQLSMCSSSNKLKTSLSFSTKT